MWRFGTNRGSLSQHVTALCWNIWQALADDIGSFCGPRHRGVVQGSVLLSHLSQSLSSHHRLLSTKGSKYSLIRIVLSVLVLTVTDKNERTSGRRFYHGRRFSLGSVRVGGAAVAHAIPVEVPHLLPIFLLRAGMYSVLGDQESR